MSTPLHKLVEKLNQWHYRRNPNKQAWDFLIVVIILAVLLWWFS